MLIFDLIDPAQKALFYRTGRLGVLIGISSVFLQFAAHAATLNMFSLV
jgi:hypothetical protein